MSGSRDDDDDDGGDDNNREEEEEEMNEKEEKEEEDVRRRLGSVRLANAHSAAAAPTFTTSASVLRKEITFKFRVKFYTKWGENVVVCGKSHALGGYDATKGAWMSCEHVLKRKRRRKKKDRGDGSAFKKKEEYESDYHAKNNGEEREDENEDEDDDEDEEYEGDELIWTATKTMRWDEPLEYRYAVVDSHGSVI